MLGGRISNQDEDEVEDELEALEGEVGAYDSVSNEHGERILLSIIGRALASIYPRSLQWICRTHRFRRCQRKAKLGARLVRKLDQKPHVQHRKP